MKAKLANRAVTARVEYDKRATKLSQAWGLTKDALRI